MLFRIGILFALAISSLAEDDPKWVWRDNGRSASSNRVASPRYEIFEKDDLDYPGIGVGGGGGPGFDFNRPPLRPGNRPFPRPPGLVDQGNIDNFRPERPGLVDQGNINNFRPDSPGAGYYPQGEYPGDQELGRPPFKKFDTCTCSERFNCKSPGISYGHCDVGKSYCCFNKYGGLDVEPAPSRPIHSPENGILVGPGHGGGGGYGRPGYAGRPGLGRPPIRDQGVLVGPGGPTGIIGRPYGGGFGRPELSGFGRPVNGGFGRPENGGFGGLENGVLVGPGGPVDRPYYGRPGGIYGRSAAPTKKE